MQFVIGCWSQVASVPAPFKDISTVDIVPGMKPVAVYRMREGKKNFSCVGTVYRADEETMEVILPEHLFTLKVSASEVFLVQAVQPERSLGFIGEILSSSKDWNGCDIAIARLTTNQVAVTNFSNITNSAMWYQPSSAVYTKDILTRSIRSMVTGETMSILGYGIRPNEEYFRTKKEHLSKLVVTDRNPSIIIDMKSNTGYSGTAFVDEHNRIFILHGSWSNQANLYAEAQRFSIKTYGRDIRGAVLLTGPINF